MAMFIQGSEKIIPGDSSRVDGGAVPDRALDPDSGNSVANDVVTEELDKKVNGWTKINQSPIALSDNTGAFDASSFNEFRFVVCPAGNTQYIMTNDVFKNSAEATYAFGFGGALNSSAPNGARALIQVHVNAANRNVFFASCVYDGASASSATLDVYAR